MKWTRILVFGGSGFFGTNLLLRLRTMGCPVMCCSRGDHRFRGPIPGVEYVPLDLTVRPDLRNLLRAGALVFHLASTFVPETAELAPASQRRSDIGWNLHLLRQCAEKRIGRLVFMSSGGAVYGAARTNLIAETHPTHPMCAYGVGKLIVERYLSVLRDRGLQSIVLRPANIYGPHQDPLGRAGLIVVAMWRALTGEEITIWGDGSVVRDYLYVDDLSDAILQVAFCPMAHGAYNVGSAIGTSINDLIEQIAAVTSRPLRVKYGPRRSLDSPANILATDRLRRETGWVPKFSLRDGMERTWRWLEHHELANAVGARHPWSFACSELSAAHQQSWGVEADRGYGKEQNGNLHRHSST